MPLPGQVSRPVSSQDLDRLLASVRAHPARPAVRDAIVRRIERARDEDRLSSHWPVATDFVVDERGRLWVVLVTERDMIRRTDIGGRRYSYAPLDGGGRSLAVFDPESRTWRTGSLPVEGELVAVQNGQNLCADYRRAGRPIHQGVSNRMTERTRMPILALIVSTFVPGGIPIAAAQERDLSHQLTVTEVWDYDGSTELGGFARTRRRDLRSGVRRRRGFRFPHSNLSERDPQCKAGTRKGRKTARTLP